MLFAARIVGGLMAGNISTAFAYIADITTPENRAKGMGPRAAAVLGTRQVFFAVVSTTVTLAAVFIPISFFPGRHSVWRSPRQWGRRQREFVEHVFSEAARS